MSNSPIPDPVAEPGEPHRGSWIVCVPMPTPTGEWYVDSVEVRRPNGVGGLDAEMFRDPLKDESYPSRDEAQQAGLEYGRRVIDSR